MLIPPVRFLSKKEWIFAGFAIIIAVLSGYAMYKAGSVVTGPFIVGDEFEYFSYAYDLFVGADLSGHTQYGAFYPALVAFFFNLGDLESVYSALRLFNIVVFVSSAIPAFLLARLLLPKSAMLFLLPAFVVTVPFSGFVYLIWADPLYYALFLWTALALLQFYRLPGVVIGGACGILLALLFHTKPGAGLIVQLSAFVSLVTLVIAVPSHNRRRLLVPIAALILCCLGLTLPWMARNLSLGVGILGYSGATSDLASRIAEYGYGHILKESTMGVFYQLAYVFIGTWGLLGVLVVISLKRWRSLPAELSTLVVFTFTCTAGMIALCTIGDISYRGLAYWMPIGRYLSVISPLTVALTICLLLRGTNRTDSEIFWQTLVTAIFIGVAILATPLFFATPAGIVSSPDTALPMWIIDKGRLVWRGMYTPSIIERSVLAAIAGLLGLLVMLLSKKREIFFSLVILILAGSIVAALATHSYLRTIAETQSSLNDAIRFLYKNKALMDGSAFDLKMKGGNEELISKFWMINHKTGSGKTTYLDANDVVQHADNLITPSFFVSREKLPFPLAFSSNGIFVYHLSASQAKKGA